MWLGSEYSNSHTETCLLCQREVPYAEALGMEGKEYLYFFCGAGCYERWQSV